MVFVEEDEAESRVKAEKKRNKPKKKKQAI